MKLNTKHLRQISKKIPSFLMASIIMMSTGAYAKNVALLIGISDYQHDVRDLQGPANDVPALKEALQKHWGFLPQDIVVLQDAQATKSNILAQIEALQSRSKAGDEVLIYFSGHGTSVHDREFLARQVSEDVLSSNSGALVPYEVNIKKISEELAVSPAEAIKNNLITGQHHLRPLLAKLDKDRNVTVILDACYSGHSTRSLRNTGAIARNISLPTTFSSGTSSLAPVAPPTKYPYQNTISIGASHHSQKAFEDDRVTLSGKHHGLLTDALLRVITGDTKYQGVLTYGKLKSLIEQQFQLYNTALTEDQTPMIQPFWEEEHHARLMHRSLFGNSRSPHSGTASSASSATVHIVTKEKNELLSHLSDHSMIQVVESGSIDFRIEKNNSGSWSMSLGNQQSVLQNANITQVINRLTAAHWLKQIEKTATQKASISFLSKPEHKGNHFDEGDLIQFATVIDRDSAILLFNISNQGYINILYPIMPSENITFSANKRVVIPEDSPVIVQPPFGYDQLVLVALKTPLTDQERAKLSPLLADNTYPIKSQVINELTNIIQNKAIGLQLLGVQTYKK